MRGSNYLSVPLRRVRIWKYRVLSTCQRVSGSPIILQPVLFMGDGTIALGQGVEFGWPTSTLFYSGYCHIEASTPESSIELGDGVQVNNNAFIKSEGPGIRIGARALLGSGVTIYDSDFHDLRPNRRRDGRPRMAPVELGEDVFVGDGAKILKGVSIGAHSVIGAGSVVTSSIPAGVIAAGNPARVIRALDGMPTDLESAGRESADEKPTDPEPTDRKLTALEPVAEEKGADEEHAGEKHADKELVEEKLVEDRIAVGR
jgi:acetyltransferase-like isoleucine patch superfamily enzyme